MDVRSAAAGGASVTLNNTGTLRPQIGLLPATALVVGEVIAVGIFLTTGRMAAGLPSPIWMLGIWCGMGAMALCGALCYGELAARFPRAGGIYVYAREIWGPGTAFLYGWMSLLVLDPGISAALAIGAGDYAGRVIPALQGVRLLTATSLIVALAAVNVVGTRIGAGFLASMAALKVGILLCIIGASALLGSSDNLETWFRPVSSAGPLIGALAASSVAAYFSFGGWWDLSKISEEIRDPGRLMSRAWTLGVTTVVVIYIFTAGAFVYLVPFGPGLDAQAFVGAMGRSILGSAGDVGFSACVLASLVGSLAAVMMASPRVYFAMGRDGIFFSAIGRVHSRFGTPAAAIGLQAAVACVMVLSGTFDQIIGYFIFVANIFVALPVAGLLRIRSSSDGFDGHRAWGYPYTAWLYLVGAAVFLVLMTLEYPWESLIGCCVVAAGWPLYKFFFDRRGLPSSQDSAGRGGNNRGKESKP